MIHILVLGLVPALFPAMRLPWQVFAKVEVVASPSAETRLPDCNVVRSDRRWKHLNTIEWQRRDLRRAKKMRSSAVTGHRGSSCLMPH